MLLPSPKHLLLLLPTVCALPTQTPITKRPDPFSFSPYVDVFFGTDGGGRVFPGPSRPFGFVKMGVDVINATMGDTYSGYAPDGLIFGISMMHLSGTGGAPQYGVVSQLPLVGEFDIGEELAQPRLENVSDIGEVGYYKVHLENGVNCSFASADKAGFYDYDFPQGEDAIIVVNVTHHEIAPRRPHWTQYFIDGMVEASTDLKSYWGYTTIIGGWGEQKPWTIYFYAEFDQKPLSVASFLNLTITDHKTFAHTIERDNPTGLIFNFGSSITNIKSRVGISFLSIEQAQQNLKTDSEQYGYNVSLAAQDTVSLWDDEVFSSVVVSEENSTLVSMLYTCLYGINLLPTNRTGENPNWNTGEPYYDDWFTLWDIFRSSIPYWHALNRKRSSELVRALIDIWRHDGFMPDGRSAHQNGRTQGGSNSDVVLADAWLKNIPDINWKDGLAAMIMNAEVDPPFRYSPFSPDASSFEGRGGLDDWHSIGYISTNYTRSLTRTMEYSFNDYAVSVVANGLGHQSLSETYLKRSSQWQNVWNFDATLENHTYTGFIQPRDIDGGWLMTNYTPVTCGKCYWLDYTYEGSPLEYGWGAPHDMETLVRFIGDHEVVEERLDDMFELYGVGYADIGNEPSFLTPYLYNFINNSTRSAETVRFLMDTRFGNGSFGLPGNSDAGAMQSWMFWAMMGLYPVTGTTTYLLSAPMFETVKLKVGGGHDLFIHGENIQLSPEHRYVQRVEVNGVPWNKNWVTHEDLFVEGGVLKFVMGTDAVVWETGGVPPSPGHVDLGF